MHITSHLTILVLSRTFANLIYTTKVILKVSNEVIIFLLRKENNFKLHIHQHILLLVVIMRYMRSSHLSNLQVVICIVILLKIIRNIHLHCNKLNNYRALCVLHKCNKIYRRGLAARKHLIKIIYCKVCLTYVKTW